jgi:CHRD domain
MAMRIRMLLILVMALALMHVAPVAAGQAMGNAKAMLTGDAEVPGPGDPKASGTVVVTLKPDTSEVCCELSVANLQEETAAHIHQGEKGAEGPVAVPLDAPKIGAAKGCTKADVVVIEALMQDPTDYYVIVHTAAFPEGGRARTTLQVGHATSHAARGGWHVRRCLSGDSGVPARP